MLQQKALAHNADKPQVARGGRVAHGEMRRRAQRKRGGCPNVKPCGRRIEALKLVKCERRRLVAGNSRPPAIRGAHRR